jgi:cytochrome d ubiquinol oxidase subunit II
MAPETLAAGAIVASLTLYLLFGGADFGGGVWDLFATGPRKDDQRALIEKAIGPIWEANHVWLILAVVLLFSAFPPAFAMVSVAFHVPLTLLLLGIVFRGSTFAFRSFDAANPRRRAGWGIGFSVASLLAPLLLGVVVGAVASGTLAPSAEGVPAAGFFAPWLAAFPLAVGALTLALCAQLAAVYLAYEARATPALADDFRRRALVAGAVVVLAGAVTLALAAGGAPRLYARLVGSAWSPVLVGAATLAAGGMFVALARRYFGWARVLAAGEATLVVAGWAAAQHPYLVVESLTVSNAAAPPRTLNLVLAVLALGLVVLLPSLYLLFRVFKAGGGAPPPLRQ